MLISNFNYKEVNDCTSSLIENEKFYKQETQKTSNPNSTPAYLSAPSLHKSLIF